MTNLSRSPRHPPDDPAAGNRRRILVVDDNRDRPLTLAKMLKLLGNEVRTAHNGIEAVKPAEEFRPEVILMDVGMPGMNGYEATRRIREQPWARNTIIIALTGWGQEGDRIQSSEAGCDGHLVKPVSLPDLEETLDRYRAATALGARSRRLRPPPSSCRLGFRGAGFYIYRFAPWLRRSVTTFSQPSDLASWSGVDPWSVLAFASAPDSSRTRTVAVLPASPGDAKMSILCRLLNLPAKDRPRAAV